MSYIPPHLRRQRANQAPPPASSSTQLPHLSSSDVIYHRPHRSIRSSSDVIYRFIVLLHHEHMSCQHVKFTRFEGETYSHLQQLQLYTLTADLDPAQQNSTEFIEPIRRNPVNVIVQSLKEDLKEVLEKLGRFTHAENRDRMVPSIVLRFGRNVFHDRRGYFDWGRSYTPENLERNVKTRKLLNTFNDCLPREDFDFLHELVHNDALHIRSEEDIHIQVEDATRPGSDLLFTCSLSEHVNPGKRELKEVQGVLPNPIRHMIGDVACVGKRRDIRLAFRMEENPPGLTETELCDLKSSFSKASIDDLHWPRHSTSGRFKVVRSSHWIRTVVIGGGLKWYLDSSGESYHVYVKPIICEEFCEGRKEWNTEMVILSIEELLQRVWADCI